MPLKCRPALMSVIVLACGAVLAGPPMNERHGRRPPALLNEPSFHLLVLGPAKSNWRTSARPWSSAGSPAQRKIEKCKGCVGTLCKSCLGTRHYL